MAPRARPRAVVVGGGLMGRWHAHAIARIGASLHAVVDPTISRAQTVAAAHTGARAYAALGEALADGDIDVVHICSPLETHERLARQSIEAGCHVLIEKPLAATAEETERLLELARTAGVLLCPTHQFLFQPGVERMLARVPQMGSLRHVDLTVCSAGADGGSDAEAARVAADMLPHQLALLGRLMPGRLPSVTWHRLRLGPGEIRVFGSVDSVAVGILVSMGGRPTRSTMRIIGEFGTAHVDLFHGFCVMERPAVSRGHKIARPFMLAGYTLAGAARNLAVRAVRREPAFPGLRELVRRFYRAVSEGGTSPISHDEVLAVATARDAILDATDV